MTTLIIGGGWSGLAAAVTLSQQGHSVQLLESAKQLGGRARNISWQNQHIDNGQHLMIGAYDRMLATMELVGINPENAFSRSTMDISIHDLHHPTLKLSALSLLPWPLSLAWNLIKSAGLFGFISVARLQSSIPEILKNKDKPVSEWLLSTRQPQRLITQLWEPLCLATLNTPIEQASSHLLATVLQDTLGKGQHAADALIPKIPLGDIFPHAAARYISGNGGEISLQTRVKQVLIKDKKVSGVITQDGTQLIADNIILATNPSQCNELLSNIVSINKATEYPITTVYLQYPSHIRLSKPMQGMTGTIGQWIFDRSEQTPGLIAIVISAPGKHEAMNKQELVQHISQEVRQFFPELPDMANDSLVIREKRATFASTVDIETKRPKSQTDIQGLWLAGDYIANGYPATLEGAIRNGENCALQLLNQH